MNNVELVQKGYQHFSEGKLDALRELFHPDIIWQECQGFPFIEGDGVFKDPEAIVQGVLSQLPTHYNGFSIAIQELFGSGEKVVMVGHYLGVYKETGKPFKANATHVWTVKNGKLAHFFVAVDTAEIINP
ncbi:MAG: nuclear transport factor 2 family protein [bacterium]